MPQDAPLLSSGQGTGSCIWNTFSKHTNIAKPLGMETHNIQGRHDVLHWRLHFHRRRCKFRQFSFTCSFFPNCWSFFKGPKLTTQAQTVFSQPVICKTSIREERQSTQITNFSPTSALTTPVTLISSSGTEPLMTSEQEQCQMVLKIPGLIFCKIHSSKPPKDSEQWWLYLGSRGIQVLQIP